MSDFFYVFECGSSKSCWGRYVVPADAYQVSVDSDGNINLTPCMYGASVWFSRINKKTFRVFAAGDLALTLDREILSGKGETK